jgi:hypothetical protein
MPSIIESYRIFIKNTDIDIPGIRYLQNTIYTNCIYPFKGMLINNKIDNAKCSIEDFPGICFSNAEGEEFSYLYDSKTTKDIVDSCSSSHIDVHYSKRIKIYTLSIIRKPVVFLSIVYFEILVFFTHLLTKKNFFFRSGKIDIERIVIVRSNTQLTSIDLYLRETKKETLLIIYPSRTQRKLFHIVSKKKYKKNIIVECLSPNLIFQMSLYQQCIKQWFKCRKRIVFKYNANYLPLRFAFLEVVFFLPSLFDYKFQITTVLKKYSLSKKSCYLSLEYKSGYVYVDSEISKHYKIPLIQVQIVDNALTDMPIEVTGKYMLCESKVIKNVFGKYWISSKEKFIYIGSIKKVNAMRDEEGVEEKLINKRSVLILGGPLNKALNLKFVNCIMHGITDTETHISYKPHPRLDLSKKVKHTYKESIYIVNDIKISFHEYLKNFDVVYCFPTSLITEILDTGIQIVVFKPDILPYRNQDQYFYSLQCIKVVKNLEELTEAVKINWHLLKSSRSSEGESINCENYDNEIDNCILNKGERV